MKKIKVISAVAIALIIMVFIAFSLSKGVPDNQPTSKKPENFTAGVWIKKYPLNNACFKFETSEGIKIVCDPYSINEKVSPDIVTESHQDADHTDTSRLTGTYKLYQFPGQYIEKGIKVMGIGGKHNKLDNGITNTIFVFDINGIRIAHFASQGKVPDEEMWAKLNTFNGIDILLIQGSKSEGNKNIKMTAEECCNVIDRLDPKIVIPEHGTADIGEDFAKHYNTKLEKADCNGFVVTKGMLKNINGHKIIDMDNMGPSD